MRFELGRASRREHFWSRAHSALLAIAAITSLSAAPLRVGALPLPRLLKNIHPGSIGQSSSASPRVTMNGSVYWK